MARCPLLRNRTGHRRPDIPPGSFYEAGGDAKPIAAQDEDAEEDGPSSFPLQPHIVGSGHVRGSHTRETAYEPSCSMSEDPVARYLGGGWGRCSSRRRLDVASAHGENRISMPMPYRCWCSPYTLLRQGGRPWELSQRRLQSWVALSRSSGALVLRRIKPSG
ncbi:hypothetical protein SI859A1_02115 [Aurantimonas manganoxydans SI85-9A1]|uniref:Uncharacterized protein n=1 Tax=Aurantimonas manganoxydans (strain ATCC BAA-1229 / DSM 21871 / SI85-9A1) TaxID=287752 RepID=Q1YMT1_AURMS|nr:hypothetical protein SI859A1_02115 [Aurantimonas manganoxydans SI85-9A1]